MEIFMAEKKSEQKVQSGSRATAPTTVKRTAGAEESRKATEPKKTKSAAAPVKSSSTAKKVSTTTQRSAAPAQRSAAPAQRAAAPTQRSAAPTQRATAARAAEAAAAKAAAAKAASASVKKTSATARRTAAPAQRTAAAASRATVATAAAAAANKSASSHKNAKRRRGGGGGKGLFGGAMYFIFVLSVSVILACLAWMAATDVLALNADNELVETVTLSKDKFDFDSHEEIDDNGNVKTVKTHTVDIDYVANELHEAGIIKFKGLFKVFCLFYDADKKLDPGTYEIKDVYDYRALISKMQSGTSAMVAVDVTIPEGYTMEQIFRKLDENGICDYDDLMYAAANATFSYDFLEGGKEGDASRLEGFLFPDTYSFYEGMNAASAINKFLEGFYYKLTAEMYDWLAESGYTWREIVNIASMIEKEAADDNTERANIASVIYNRLDEGIPLMVDAAVLYDYDEHPNGITSDMLTADKPHNTYKIVGLPSTPISNPGLASLRAALRPNDTSYLFYALDTETMTHRFFNGSSEFDAFVKTQNYG